MKFRNVKTGHILHVSNEDCIKMMQSSVTYEEVIDAPAAETPEAETAEAPAVEEAPKPKATKPKAKK